MPIPRLHCVLLATLAAAGSAIASSASARPADAKPLTPRQLLNAINFDFEELFQANTSTFDLQTLVVSAHRFSKSGRCHASTPYLPNTQEQEVSLAGIYDKFCTKLHGKYQTLRIPHRQATYPPTAATANFTPILYPVADHAAASVGLTASQHGVPQRIELHIDNSKHRSDAEVRYDRGVGIVAQLRELTLRMANGTETVKMAWYGESG